MPKIYSIVYQPKDQRYSNRQDNFIRVPTETANLIVGHGIENDQKAGHNPRRQLNLLSYDWLEAKKSADYQTEPGDFGEQLVIKGIDFNTLNPSDRLYLGEEACIEITGPRVGCNRLESAQGMSDGSLEGTHIGMLARVVQSGTIRIGDPVKLQPVPQVA